MLRSSFVTIMDEENSLTSYEAYNFELWLLWQVKPLPPKHVR